MRTGTFLFAAWCMGISGLFLLATTYAWSPFADASAPSARARSGGGGGVIFIPTHK